MASALGNQHRESSIHPSPPASSPFASLPTEIQLRILHYSLTYTVPELNLRTLQPVVQESMTTNKEYNWKPSHSFTSILATCRLFRDEGWRYLVRNNDFIYSRRNYDRTDLLHPRTWHLKPTIFGTLTRITLRHTFVVPRYFEVETVLYLAECLGYMPALRSVRIDFYEVSIGTVCQDRDAIVQSAQEFCELYRQNRHIGYPNGRRCLEEVIITGLQRDDISYLAIWAASTLVKSEGQMGLHFVLQRHLSVLLITVVNYRSPWQEENEMSRGHEREGVELEWVKWHDFGSWIKERLSRREGRERVEWSRFALGEEARKDGSVLG